MTGASRTTRRTASAEEAASVAAQVLAEALRSAVADRGVATLALSGGRTPERMVQLLGQHRVPWPSVHLFQVDERAVPPGDPARNWPLMSPVMDVMEPGHAHPMPVEHPDADVRYAMELADACGQPPVLDVVQLGLGADGHTASLPPGDPVVDVDDRDVAWSQEYAGHRRLTLTLPVLGRARLVVWLVVGADKAHAVRELVDDVGGSVAARVANAHQVLVVDPGAAAFLEG